MSITPTFAGEIQLAGWSETHTGGCKVTFWLPSSADLDAFRELTVRKGNTAGHRFMAALVEIGDDEQPVQSSAEYDNRHAEQTPDAPKGGPIAKLAGMWGTDPEFVAWLTERGDFKERLSFPKAAQVVRDWCGVTSRAELDSNPEAEAKFQKLIRGPYMKHMAVTA